MDTLIETILRDHARRLEQLEAKRTPVARSNSGVRLATDSQIRYAQKLGGTIYEGITHEQVSKMIDELLKTNKINEYPETRKESPEIEAQIQATSKPLTEDQIAEIGEGNLL